MTQQSTSAPIHNIVIGTAGHIDHGKTSLIRRLTGIDADRLPEEKERGMTIDLGFARYELSSGRRVGIIDVPGHERFVKNMVAGAFGIDIVVLVVAADDGVMPQTREHLEIMRLLGLRHGMVAVTKIDLVDEDLRELVVEDIRDTATGTFLEQAPILPVSSTTGEGFDAFVETLNAAIEEVEPRSTDGVFRMPIQRVFSSKGFGTVVTGVPLSGRAAPGDTLEILPLGKTGRVRGIQAYMTSAEIAQAGQSSAVNVTDLDYREVHRGMVTATPGHFRAAKMFETRFQYLASSSRPLRHRTRVRFHCGTAEVLGDIHILEGKVVSPGETCLAQIRLDEPVVAVPGDHFVLRLHSPMFTIGGGEIIDASRWRLKQGKSFVIDQLSDKEKALSSPRHMVLNSIMERGFEAVPEKEVARGSGIPPEQIRALLDELLEAGEIFRAKRAGTVISLLRFEEAKEHARASAESFFAENPRRLLMEKVVLRQAIGGQDPFFNELLARLEEAGDVSPRGEFLRWAFHAPRLSDDERELHDLIATSVREGRFTPPRAEDVAEENGFSAKAAADVVTLLEEEGELVRLADDVHYHRESVEAARELVREHLESEGSMTASAAKTIIGTSRKYIIPLLEYFDAEGFTIRRGDVRELRKRI